MKLVFVTLTIFSIDIVVSILYFQKLEFDKSVGGTWYDTTLK